MAKKSPEEVTFKHWLEQPQRRQKRNPDRVGSVKAPRPPYIKRRKKAQGLECGGREKELRDEV